jgi:hypothetical protein
MHRQDAGVRKERGLVSGVRVTNSLGLPEWDVYVQSYSQKHEISFLTRIAQRTV